MIKEWWLKDTLNETECKLKNQFNVTNSMVEFYEGRLYQKEVAEKTTHYEWVKIEEND